MKLGKFLGWSSALCLSALPLAAQETNVEQLQKQIDALQRQLDELKKAPAPPATDPLKEDMGRSIFDVKRPAVAEENRRWSVTDPIRIQRGQAYMDIGLVGTFAAGGSTADDIDGGLQLGGHDPLQRGFTVQGVEANFAGAIDPYFRGNATVLFQIDTEGDTLVELEEGYLETLGLPGNLQLRGGQYLTEFGRQNVLHTHAWGFVDTPLVNGRFFGPDGLRNLGARLSWLAPTPFYSELFFSVQNSHGVTAHSFRSEGGHGHGAEEDEEIPLAFRHADNDRGVRHLDDLLFAPRYALSFEPTASQTVLVGASAAFGPNSRGGAGDTDTQIYGADLTWKWRPVTHSGGFPFVTWQTEAMLRKYDAGAFDWDEDGNGGDSDGDGFVDEGILVDPGTGLPAVLGRERLTDYGFYTQMLYGFRKGWVAGLRFDYVTGKRGDYEKSGLLVADGAGGGDAAGRDLFRASRYRVSPNLTWYPSEFSKIRLQYNYDDRQSIGVDHSVWLQFEFVLGAHAAHKF